MPIESLDHLVLTVRDVTATCSFYTQVLGMQAVTFANGRQALHFGTQKINLHQAGHEFEPKAQAPLPGSADLCFLTSTPLPELVGHLKKCRVSVEEGPVKRTGANGSIFSVYLRDPDGNLIEVSNPLPTLFLPSECYQESYLAALREFQADGERIEWNVEYLERHFPAHIQELRNLSNPQKVKPKHVPSAIYWLIDEDGFAGQASLRYELNDWLRRYGGHIGYGIRPSKRRQGYGRQVLALMLNKARQRGLARVLVTCDEDNIGSRKIIEYNGGKLENAVVQEGIAARKLRFWIDISPC